MAARDHFRAHARRRVDVGATLRDASGVAQPVRVRDLGLGGAGLELPEAPALEPQAPVTLEVTAPTLWDPLTLRATVVWVRRGAAGKPTRTGVRFEHHDAAALYALYQMLDAHVFEP